MFAKLLKEYRNHLHYTQEELADKLDISVNHLSRIELEKAQPSGALIHKILLMFSNDSISFDINIQHKELYTLILIAQLNDLDDEACHIVFSNALQLIKWLKKPTNNSHS